MGGRTRCGRGGARGGEKERGGKRRGGTGENSGRGGEKAREERDLGEGIAEDVGWERREGLREGRDGG